MTGGRVGFRSAARYSGIRLSFRVRGRRPRAFLSWLVRLTWAHRGVIWLRLLVARCRRRVALVFCSEIFVDRRLAVALLRYCRCFSAHDGHLVWPGNAGWEQSLHRPSSFARWRRRCSISRCSCLRSGVWLLALSYSWRFCRRSSSSSSGVDTRGERLSFFGFAALGLRLVGFRFGVGLTGKATVYWNWILLEKRSGEPPHRRQVQSKAPGLSPRVRGNRVTWTATAMANRSIPARAGEPPKRKASHR